MKKKILVKTLAIGVIILFFGASVVSSINNDVETELSSINNDVETELSSIANGEWWYNDWICRKQITIHHTEVDDDLSNFPVLITHTSTDLINYAQSDGDDFVFTTADGTKLNHEIELYRSSSGQVVAWVNIPSLLSSSDTILYMYYGNPDCSSQQIPEKVWDSNYIGVYHMSESSGNLVDSTINGREIPVGNAPMYGENGKIAKCMTFDGNNDYFERSYYYDVSSLTGVTFEVWFESTSGWSASEWPYIVTLGRGNNYVQDLGVRWVGITSHDRHGQFEMIAARHALADRVNSTHKYFSGWQHVTGTFTNSEIAICVNGLVEATDSVNTNDFSDFTDDYIEIGRSNRKYSGWEYHTGKFDEIRISKIVRGPAWVITSYNNQNDPESFITVGTQETVPVNNTLFFGKIENLMTMVEFTRFHAVNLRAVQFSPFSFQKYTAGETIVISSKLGILSPTFAFGLFGAAI